MIMCSNCAAEEAVSKEYPYCSEACEREYLATHDGKQPKVLIEQLPGNKGRFVGLCPF